MSYQSITSIQEKKIEMILILYLVISAMTVPHRNIPIKAPTASKINQLLSGGHARIGTHVEPRPISVSREVANFFGKPQEGFVIPTREELKNARIRIHKLLDAVDNKIMLEEIIHEVSILDSAVPFKLQVIRQERQKLLKLRAKIEEIRKMVRGSRNVESE